MTYLKMITATALLGSYLVASKLILLELPVFAATFLRLIVASTALALYLWLKGRREKALGTWIRPRRPGRKDSAVLFTQTLFGVFLFSVFAMYGVKLTGAIEAGVILGMVPVSVTLVAVLLLREKMTSFRILGTTLAVLGAVSINVVSAGSSTGQSSTDAVIGALLLGGAVLFEAAFLTFGKLLTVPIPPAKLSLILSLGGALMFSVPAALEFDWTTLPAVSWQTWALVIYTGVAIGGVAAVLMYSSLNTVDAMVVATFTALTPVSGAILSVFFLGETLHIYHIAGMTLVIVGVIISARGSSRLRKQTEAPLTPDQVPPTKLSAKL